MISKVDVNGVELVAGSGVAGFTKINGLDMPTRRSSVITYADRHGGTVPKQLYGNRVITVEGNINARTCAEHLNERARLLEAIPIDEFVPVDFYLHDGRILRVHAKFDTPELPIESDKYTEFQLQATSSSYLMTDISKTTLNSIKLKTSSSGGWKELPSRWDNTEGAYIEYPYRLEENALNSGKYTASPIIRILGEHRNPRITNTTTGEFIQVNITTSANDVIEIDTDSGTVKLNGGNISSLVGVGSKMFKLAVGDNMLKLESDKSVGDVVVEWLPTYIGI